MNTSTHVSSGAKIQVSGAWCVNDPCRCISLACIKKLREPKTCGAMVKPAFSLAFFFFLDIFSFSSSGSSS